VSLARELAESGRLNFGRGRLVPKRQFTLEEVRLNKIEPEKLLSPKDTTLDAVRAKLQLGAAAAALGTVYAAHLPPASVLYGAALYAFGVVLDQVACRGGVGALVLDTAGRALASDYADRVALHEAGHFLTAYLVGLLPKGYSLSSLDAYLRARTLNVQAGCSFCDAEFQAEVASGRIASTSVDRYAMVALAGVVTEYQCFGTAEGGLGDIMQLDNLLRAMGWTQRKADDQVRWSVVATADLLRRHRALHVDLARAMKRGDSVGDCIRLIEERLAACDDV